MNTTTPARTAAPWWAGAVAGFLAAASGVAVGTGVAALLQGVPSPIESVGNRAIDYAPPFLKEFAVKQFGTADKPILIGGVVVTLAILAMVAGVIGRSKPRLAVGAVALIGVIAVAAAAIDRTTTASRALTLIPSVLTLAVSLAVLIVLLGTLTQLNRKLESLPAGFDRRKFLKVALGASALVVVGGVVGRVYGSAAAAASRAGIRLPGAAIAAPPIPAGVQLDLKGITPFVTPNRDFYRVDTALRVPDVPAEGWNLRIHGMVDKELNLSYRDIMNMPLVENRITLTCVSNEVGGRYLGNAAWLGVLTKDLLEMAGVQSGADAIKSTSADRWTAGTPLDVVTDERNAMLAIGMNGEPLPLEHGFPARLVVPGLYGFVSATKWLVDIEVTRFSDFKGYWTTRDYTAEAPIKFSSRIDVPKSFQSFPRDKVRLGGVAWAQTVGIEQVEIKIDDGPWEIATLGAEDNLETWRQWMWQWDDATEGTHKATIRATNKNGKTQTSERARIRPNGTTGWHSVQFRVE
ncbi:DMSO/TMAO reductase YedYZ molybdopterin-dependent catalytic subunit [Aeromicrobium panaciterrae]|uniref:DMSO/TMAO reductase YedYZ molybdopterin-dependent catalytic subunit n=1 Tax=Aeromicrobium panaciterrae TaxID=363861 RepID=A0ABU1UK88_9ACTN|nr:molybdopterin-dependent oxidoreductase [Aeromicrobium panaciterrae]MDR7085607.1 DMSO/TMAO reductase YedYZ molybdopterin-dependent catalytic subunit [Aeromicrobium panaciterrae]